MIIRIFDIVFASLALVILLPILTIVGVALKFTGEGEVFYLQSRVGKDLIAFDLIKFATMLKDSPNIGMGTITVADDPRVLPLGKILRISKINELPQLINVLIGDMSLIGPRPVAEDQIENFSLHNRKKIFSVRPGLSGVASIVFRNEEAIISKVENPKQFHGNEIAKYKEVLESWFVDNRNFFLYLVLIILTVIVVFPFKNFIFKVLKKLPQPEGKLRELSK